MRAQNTFSLPFLATGGGSVAQNSDSFFLSSSPSRLLALCSNRTLTQSWDLSYFPIADDQPYDRFGKPYDITRVLTKDDLFNQTAYENYSPLYLPATYAVSSFRL